MRILHAPTNIANQPWNLAQGLRKLGHQVEVWHFGENRFGFPCDRAVETTKQASDYWRLLVEAVEADFDVVHFHFGNSLIPAVAGLPWFWDLPVWRALGKRVVFTFHGSDVRLESLSRSLDPWSPYKFANVPSDEERIKAKLAVIRTYANQILVAGVSRLEYVPDATYIPLAIELENIPNAEPGAVQRPRVLHCPSRRATKGTQFILDAVERLEDTDIEFDFMLVEGASHAEFRKEVARSDIVIDKVIGEDISMTSLEAMAQGKPVISRLWAQVTTRHPDIPIVNADPESLRAALMRLVQSPELRARLARKGRSYVASNHDAGIVASQLLPFYVGPTSGAPRTFPRWSAVPPTSKKLAALEARVRQGRADVMSLRRKLSTRARPSPTTQDSTLTPDSDGREQYTEDG